MKGIQASLSFHAALAPIVAHFRVNIPFIDKKLLSVGELNSGLNRDKVAY